MQLEVQNISFSYVPSREVFHGISFSLEEGECLSILGANGAGKSTLLNCLAGLLTPRTGQILLDGRPVRSYSRREIARLIGYVPQIHDSSFAYTVLEFVVMGRTPYIPPYGRPSREDYRIAAANLERIGMAGMEQAIYTELSGGEQQLCMIARVLTQEAKIILLDEPTNHLDFGNQYRTVERIRSLAHAHYTILSTTHNPDHAFMLGGKAAILDRDGSLMLGPAEEILTAERLSKLYGIPIGISHSPEAGRRICFAKT